MKYVWTVVEEYRCLWKLAFKPLKRRRKLSIHKSTCLFKSKYPYFNFAGNLTNVIRVHGGLVNIKMSVAHAELSQRFFVPHLKRLPHSQSFDPSHCNVQFYLEFYPLFMPDRDKDTYINWLTRKVNVLKAFLARNCLRDSYPTLTRNVSMRCVCDQILWISWKILHFVSRSGRIELKSFKDLKTLLQCSLCQSKSIVGSTQIVATATLVWCCESQPEFLIIQPLRAIG